MPDTSPAPKLDFAKAERLASALQWSLASTSELHDVSQKMLLGMDKRGKFFVQVVPEATRGGWFGWPYQIDVRGEEICRRKTSKDTLFIVFDNHVVGRLKKSGETTLRLLNTPFNPNRR